MVATQQEIALKAISGASIFSRIPSEAHEFLARNAAIKQYAPREIVGIEGGTTGFMFGVVSGRLRCLKFSPEGRRLVFTYFEPGSWAGYYWAMDDGAAVMDVEAVNETACVLIPRKILLEAGNRWPRLYEGLFHELLRITRPLFGRLELEVAHRLSERVSLVLLALLDQHRTDTPSGIRLDMAITQAELAGMAFCSRQHLNKILREWVERRIISMDGRKAIVIHDLNALIAEARPRQAAV